MLKKIVLLFKSPAFYSFLQRSALVLAALALFLQFASLAGYLHERSDHQSMVAAKDNDAGRGIKTALNSRPWGDNGFRAYGPVYYRIAYLLDKIVSNPELGEPRSKKQRRERNIHFCLLILSLLAIYGFSYLIALQLTKELSLQMISTFLLVGAFLQSPVWVEMVYRVHPDHFFSLIVAMATLFGIKFVRQPEKLYFLKLTAILWGIAASTKMTALMFAPSLLVFFFPWSKTESLARFKLCLKYSFISYFVVGFPQNFDVIRTLRFLSKQSRNVVWVDGPFFQNWIKLFQEQLLLPLALVLILGVIVQLFRRNHESLSRSEWQKILILAAGPILFLISRKITSSYHYYPLPFVVVFLICFSVLLKTKTFMLPRLKWHPAYAILLLFIGPKFVSAVPNSFAKELPKQLECREEAFQVEQLLTAAIDKGEHIMADPYVPINSDWSKDQVSVSWGFHPEDIVEGKTSTLAFKTSFYLRYLPRSIGGRPHVNNKLWDKDFKKIEEFYRLFHQKSETRDIHGQRWQKLDLDLCGWEIWRRQNQ